ncbi:integrase, catalytic region, zinc finger, CCHC-type containing protein, partial [Tanacetum coccineum]
SSFKNSILSNTKNSSEKVEVLIGQPKKPDVTSKNVALNKKIITNDDIKNALIAKNVLCVSCAKNVLIPCHDNCLAKYKLNVHSKVRRALITTPIIVKSKFEDTTPIVSKTRFSVKIIQSKSLDPTPIVSKTKIVVVTPLSAKNKVVQIILWIVDSSCSKHMTGDRSLLKTFVEKFIGLGHNLFSVEQFCDGDLEVVLRSKTCYVLNMEGDDLLTGDRESNLYTISISDMDASSPVCLISKATSTKSWLWHRIMQQFSTARTPQQNGVVERCNRTLVEVARTMLIFSRLPEFLWAEAVSTACFTQNRSIIYTRHNKTPYELLHGRKPNVEYFHVFGSMCYPTNDRDDLGKMKPKADIGIFIGII